MDPADVLSVKAAHKALHKIGEAIRAGEPLQELRRIMRARLKQLMRERRARRKKLKALRRKDSRPPKRVNGLTKTVSYRYDEADNAAIEAFYNSAEWRMARYEALRRDGGYCACCGRHPPAVILNVDHIVGLRVDWSRRLDVSNLQVLCADCNAGKGARHADDWRA